MTYTKPDKQLIIIHILITLVALSPLWVILGFSIAYEEPTTEIVSTLICSGIVITENQDYLYTTRGGMYEFTNGSYTPKQGEICIVQRKEVKL